MHIDIHRCDRMKETELIRLREKYEKMLAEGHRCYFEPDEIEHIADSYEQEMEYEKSLQAAEHGLQLYPGNEVLLIRKARCLLVSERIDESAQVLALITEKGIEYHFVRSEIALLQGDDATALESFQAIIGLSDCTIEDCIDVLDICAELDKVYLLELFTPLVESRYDDVTPYWRELAILHEDLEEFDRAIELYNKILDVNSFSSDCWFSLAKVYARIKNYDSAIEACDFALAIAGDDENIIAFKGYCYYDSEQFYKAIEQFNIFLEATADKAVAYELIAESYGRMDLHEQAIENLLKAIELNDRSHDLYYQLAVNYYYMGHVDDAIANLYKAVACDDNDDEAHVFLGELLLQKHDYPSAYEHLLRTERTPIADTISATAFVDAAIHLQRYDEAIPVLTQLIDKEPYEPHFYFDIVLCYLQLGDYEQAARWVACSEEVSNETDVIDTLNEASRKAWKSIRERIAELRNVLKVYLNEDL